ncbi:hypothetical protein [Blastococcus sp. SYSU D00820]
MPARPLAAAAAAAAALLLSACTASVAGVAAPPSPSGPPVEPAVRLGGDVEHGPLATGLGAGSDGTALVLVAGPYGQGWVRPVDPAAGTAGDAWELPTDARPDAVVGSGDAVLVVGEPGGDASGYAITEIDPATGGIRAVRPVAGFPAASGGSTAAVLPDGRVLVAVERHDGPLQLVVVDPATATAEPPVEVPAGEGRIGADALAVSPDGGLVAVAVTSYDADSGEAAAELVVVGPDLTPVAAPVPLPVAAPDTEVRGLAVADDGTAWAALVTGREGTLVAVEDGGPARPVDGVPLAGPAQLLATAGGPVVADGETVRVLDPADGSVVSTTAVCADGHATALATGADGALVVLGDCDGPALWLLPA